MIDSLVLLVHIIKNSKVCNSNLIKKYQFQLEDHDTLYFRDGKRRIDMVLVFVEEDLGVMTETEAKRRDNRRMFQENLRKEGLEIELENKDLSFDGKTWFLKIHIPWKTKTRYAAVMTMKYPTKRFIPISVKAWVSNTRLIAVKQLYFA